MNFSSGEVEFILNSNMYYPLLHCRILLKGKFLFNKLLFCRLRRCLFILFVIQFQGDLFVVSSVILSGSLFHYTTP